MQGKTQNNADLITNNVDNYVKRVDNYADFSHAYYVYSGVKMLKLFNI